MLYRIIQDDDPEGNLLCITVDIQVISAIINSWLAEWDEREKSSG